MSVELSFVLKYSNTCMWNCKELVRFDKFSKIRFLGPHLCWRWSPLGPHLTQNWVPMALGTSANHQRAILFFFLLKDPTFLPHCRGDCFHLIERQRRPRSGMVWIGLIFGNILKFTHICMFWCTIVHPFQQTQLCSKLCSKSLITTL